ncbi:MAG: cupin domain-containing protein [bacterium]
MITSINLFNTSFPPTNKERIDLLFQCNTVTIERICSSGSSSPEGFWYDQPTDEWVVVLQGSAGLSIEGEPETRTLKPGEAIFLPAHHRHRVEWTEAQTLWLAVHIKIENNS